MQNSDIWMQNVDGNLLKGQTDLQPFQAVNKLSVIIVVFSHLYFCTLIILKVKTTWGLSVSTRSNPSAFQEEMKT